MKIIKVILIFTCFLSSIYCSKKEKSNSSDGGYKLSAGFKIEIFASSVSGAREITLGSNGILFVGTAGRKVYAIRYSKEYKFQKLYTLTDNLNSPNGVAFRNGSLYVGEINRILRYDNIENLLDNPPKPVIVYDKLPSDRNHGLKFIRFGPDGKLYIPIGMPCNVCLQEDKRYGTINRMNPDGGGFENYASGIRNSVGFDWSPETKQLWFTDNGRDMMGDDIPPDELNKAPKQGMNFGFPFFHGGDIPDPEFGKGENPDNYTKPEQKLGPHVASLGMRFYTGSMFPPEFKNQIFIAEHGSWNRSHKIGYRITLIKLKNDKPVSYEPFAEGWLKGDSVSGRPVDLQVLPDGSLLVSDDFGGNIFRITYQK
jgi:glucose/arabinose dehydrogenase